MVRKTHSYLTSPVSDTLAVADGNMTSNMWHNRLGRISEKGMKILQSRVKLPSIESKDIDMCKDCIFKKQKRVSF